jgi:hypothetical protein
MPAFRIWGTITLVGPYQYAVVASAVPEQGYEGAAVLTAVAATPDQAETAKARLMVELGTLVAIA